MLDSFAPRNLTVLSAPCGYGKTSLLTAWCARTREHERVAWLTLEPTENNVPRFLAHVADAVERARPGGGRRAAALLRARGTTPDVAAHELLADLARAAPLAIVLDDLYVIEDRKCFDLLAYAIEHLPPGIRVVVATRADPPLPLARLRARGLLGEIRARDLAFTAAETRDVVSQLGITLEDDELEALADRTESWPVAVYLTALWLREQKDPQQMLGEFAAGRSYIGEFLAQEVLGSLDPRTRSFLVRTSVLTYLSAPLCNAVLDRDDSAEVLRVVSRSNLLITRLERDGEWFQLHRLFRELLRLELDRDDPSLSRRLHSRAAVWLDENGFVAGAVAHALSAGELEHAAGIISASAEPLLVRGDAELLVDLVEQLPLECVLAHPELSAAAALATTVARRPRHERQRWLSTAARSRRGSPAAWSSRIGIEAELAQALAADEEIGAAATHARRALRLVTKQDTGETGASARSALAHALYLEGATDEAAAEAARTLAAASPARQPSAIVRALGVLALVAADSGSDEEAASLVEKALGLVRRHGLGAAASAHLAHLARARLLLARGDTLAAENAAELGERLCRIPDPSAAHVFALLVLAESRIRKGRLRAAETAIREADAELETRTDQGRLPNLLAASRRSLRQARRSQTVSTERLTAGEIVVLRMLATALSQRAIGRELFLSVNTIKTHSRSIYRKLGVGSRAAAVARANALDLIADP